MHEAAVHSSSRRRRRGNKEHSTQSKGLQTLEALEGGLLLLLIVAAPWLFGCTERWSIALMNGGALIAGLGALTLRILKGSSEVQKDQTLDRRFAWAFFSANLVALLFCLVAVLNARATFSIETETFTYREGVISWLPTTYDREKSLEFLVNSLALFSFFWSLRFWIKSAGPGAHGQGRFDARLKLVIWVFVVNGSLLAVQGLLQRFSGSAKLLWFRPSYWGDAQSCFGPFSYRGNAVDYLNMVWPLSFGLWYTLTRRRSERQFGFGDGPELLLLPMSLITAAASFATLSRGGALVAGGMLLALFGASLAVRGSRVLRISLAAVILCVCVAAAALAGSSLAGRFRQATTDNLSGRVEIYENAQKLAADFPWFGSGPGTFMSVYQLYRANSQQTWAAWVHDDWLETRVTFGRVGMAIVLLQLAVLVFWTMSQRKHWSFPVLTFSLLLAISGCLVHAKRDFPFQTYSVFFTFVTVCALLTCTASSRRATPEETERALA